MFKQSIDLPGQKQNDSYKVAVVIQGKTRDTPQELVGAGDRLVTRGKKSFRISDILNTGNTENSRLTPTRVTWRTERECYFFFLYWDQEDSGKRWWGGYNQAGIKPAVLILSWASDSRKGLVKVWIVVSGLTPGFQFSNLGWWLRTCISRKSSDHLDAARRVPHLRWVLNSRGAQNFLKASYRGRNLPNRALLFF